MPDTRSPIALYPIYLSVQQAVVAAGGDGSFTFELTEKQMHDRRYWDNCLDPSGDMLVGCWSLPPKHANLRFCLGAIRFQRLNTGMENKMLVTDTDASKNENRQGSEEFHFPACEAHLGNGVGIVATILSANQWPV